MKHKKDESWIQENFSGPELSLIGEACLCEFWKCNPVSTLHVSVGDEVRLRHIRLGVDVAGLISKLQGLSDAKTRGLIKWAVRHNKDD